MLAIGAACLYNRVLYYVALREVFPNEKEEKLAAMYT